MPPSLEIRVKAPEITREDLLRAVNDGLENVCKSIGFARTRTCAEIDQESISEKDQELFLKIKFMGQDGESCPDIIRLRLQRDQIHTITGPISNALLPMGYEAVALGEAGYFNNAYCQMIWIAPIKQVGLRQTGCVDKVRSDINQYLELTQRADVQSN
jgi:hypothetical protein